MGDGPGGRAADLVEPRTGSLDLIVSVNVSGRHIGRSRFVDDALAALALSGVGPNQLMLEITATAITDETGAELNLNTCRGFGVLVGIDDFGTGHASIAGCSSCR